MELSLSSRRVIFNAMFLLCLYASIVVLVTGCGVVEPVKVIAEWVVGIAKDAGNFVIGKAGTFADALTRCWRAFWGNSLVSNVEVDKESPLKGIYQGILQCSVKWLRTDGSKKLENELSIKLNNPHMIRNSIGSAEWELAPNEMDRINSLAKQLMNTN